MDPREVARAWQPLPASAWNRAAAAHLLRRSGFGGAPDDVDQAAARGLRDTLDWLIAGVRSAPADPLTRLARRLQSGAFPYDELQSLQGAWIHKMVHAASPLRERLTLFWHGHFATGQQKVGNARWMRDQVDKLRRWAVGPFGEALGAIARDPAMLRWLDGDRNVKGTPNENFARELFELFSLGIGHYTEADVQEAARAFTGWTVAADGAVSFDRARHDGGLKVVLGRRGALDGDDVIAAVLARDACAAFLARELFSHFAYAGAEPELLAPLAARIRADGYRFDGALRMLFGASCFYAERCVLRQIKSPAEYAVGAILALGAKVAPHTVAKAMAEMGQSLYFPPNVKGWDGGRAWISSAALFSRQAFARQLVADAGPLGTSCDLVGPTAAAGATTDAARVRLWLDRLLPGQRHPALEQRLVRYLAGTTGAPRARLAELVHLILSLPEYQLA